MKLIETPQVSWDDYKSQVNLIEIPIPYAGTVGGVSVTGIFYLKDPVEDSYTDGAAIGLVNGTYHLDKNKTEIKLYDPSGNLLRLEIVLSFTDEVLKARLCNRRWNGSWRCSDYVTLASW
ncbi:hypothetical protein A6769_34295 [Nostoc punctiforme NIES-2108]|uniref:Uncharacterized protein n=1 Tax=Nostoc punctiforme NIES-2108 TaxID=1356359 RepID=A0A367R2E7_NOSPU|nr:hypothetical protein A6769_34295 [Nostoc punctiforme NIES-2108]